LKLSPKTQNDALKVLKQAESVELTSGRGPAGIAAAALYVAALMNDEKKTQREVADIAGITEVTIRNRYKELIEKLDLEEKIKQKEAESKKRKASAE
jgi:transcription initiation factor TFIIB